MVVADPVVVVVDPVVVADPVVVVCDPVVVVAAANVVADPVVVVAAPIVVVIAAPAATNVRRSKRYDAEKNVLINNFNVGLSLQIIMIKI